MVNIFRMLGLALLCCALNSLGKEPANSTKEINTSSQTSKAQVIIIGTIHNKHLKNPNYSPETLKEIILSLKPDVILNELPLSQVDPNGRPIERLRDRKISPESWASDTVGTQLGIRQIPYDRPDREENFKKTNYFERQERSQKLSKKWGNMIYEKDQNSLDLKIARLQGLASEAEARLILNGAPEIINSEAHDSIIRIKKSLWYDIMPTILQKYPGYQTLIQDYHFTRDQWNERNGIMADNVIKAARQYPGKRLLVVTGATHRYILRDLLKNEKSIKLKEYWEVKGLTTGAAEIAEEKQKQ